MKECPKLRKKHSLTLHLLETFGGILEEKLSVITRIISGESKRKYPGVNLMAFLEELFQESLKKKHEEIHTRSSVVMHEEIV